MAEVEPMGSRDRIPPRTRFGLGGLVLLLGVLLAAQDMPDDGSVHGIDRLTRKAGWSLARASFTLPPPLPYPGALVVLVLDPTTESNLGRRAAIFLALYGSPRTRLQAASALVAAGDPRGLPLLRQAIRTALASTSDCDLLIRTVKAAQSAPRTWRPVLAGEFARDLVMRRWGVAALEAGRRVAKTPGLDRRVTRARARQPGGGGRAEQRRSCVAQLPPAR